MKKLIGIIILFISFTSFSQDTYFQESAVKAKEQAIEITNEYMPELGLTGEQLLLFPQKVEEFLRRRYKIENEISGKEKLKFLYQLQQEETTEMNDI